ncbi:MAG: hypothetical protein WD557_12790 [Dehalococcoidia bacterium]
MRQTNGVVRPLRIAAAVVATAIIASVVLFEGSQATSAYSSPFPDEGVLHLHIDGTSNYFEWQKDGQIPQRSGLGGTRCAPTLSAPPLVALSGGKSAGFGDLGFGICTRANDGSSAAGRIDPGESLTLTLAGGLAAKEVTYAELDIEAKFGGVLAVKMYHNTTQVGSDSIDTSEAPDSSPDNGATDNIRLVLQPDMPFNKLVLTAVSGAFSLDGGGDGTEPGPLGDDLLTNDSVFQLTDIDFLSCGETAPLTEGSYQISYTRGNNVSTTPCTDKVFVLDVTTVGGNQGVQFGLWGGDPDATFTGSITWPPEPAAIPLRWTQIDFGDGPQDIEWCGGTLAAPSLPLGEQWCLVTHHAEIVGGGQVRVTETYYGQGDPFTWH